MTQTEYTIPEASKALNVSAKTIRRWITSGKLPAVKVQGRYGEEYRITELPEAVSDLKKPPALQRLTYRELYEENMRLAAQVGVLTERVRQLEMSNRMLEVGRTRKPWILRLFSRPRESTSLPNE